MVQRGSLQVSRVTQRRLESYRVHGEQSLGGMLAWGPLASAGTAKGAHRGRRRIPPWSGKITRASKPVWVTRNPSFDISLWRSDRGFMPMTDSKAEQVTMARFFQLLGAPLNNTRWSWGAQRADGAVFLRQWETDVVAGEDGREFVVIADGSALPEPRELGWRERLEHIAAVRAGAPCFLILCAARDPGAKAKTVRTFDARSIVVGGQVIENDERTLVEVSERRPVAGFLRGGTREQTPSDPPTTDKRTFLARELKPILDTFKSEVLYLERLTGADFV
jgi:hypothetical protein